MGTSSGTSLATDPAPLDSGVSPGVIDGRKAARYGCEPVGMWAKFVQMWANRSLAISKPQPDQHFSRGDGGI
jgi:hypothetical protein